ncbi:MAG: hypothetical protein AAGC93_00110 [Cyanobacteria bacterium P01_F01_bin.53]
MGQTLLSVSDHKHHLKPCGADGRINRYRFLGHLDDIRYLNGVALETVIFNVIYWSFNFFRMGTTGPTAQAVGKNLGPTPQDDGYSEVWLIGLRNSLPALMVGLVIWLLKDPIVALSFALLKPGSAGVKAAAMDFYNGRSRGRQVITLSVVGNASNIVLDYCFIAKLGWGSYGAGLATALSQYLMLLAGLGLIAAEVIPFTASEPNFSNPLRLKRCSASIGIF